MTILREVAHSRAGDKGDTSDISVIAYDRKDYSMLAEQVTVDKVRALFDLSGAIERYELPKLGALKFVLHGALTSGVTRSLALDAHGKCLSSLMLQLELES